VPGTPAWSELLTFETTHVAKFYETLFGYEQQATVSADAPADDVTLYLGGHPVAGIRGVGHAALRDRGPHWLTYFGTADLDDAVDRVSHLGGHILRPPHDGTGGRVATVTDPEGASFSLAQSAR
jgi:predicted enzyme related to lactoylglutathione lyase